MNSAFFADLNKKPLIVFEMANNHMGDLEHGLSTIRAFAEVSRQFPQFLFAFKFQYRNIPTFIHPDWYERLEIPYVKRFRETNLSDAERLALREEVSRQGMAAICTPFDEPSVDLVVAHRYDVCKVASASFSDWPLLERIVRTDLPIIASTATAPLATIDSVVSFLTHRNKKFALMHCVAQYPTPPEHFQFNQIDLLRTSYPHVPIGFSTHEAPSDLDPVKLAVAKGCRIFEKHVALETQKYKSNAYSASPSQIADWLRAIDTAIKMCGVEGTRATPTEKETADISQFRRGVFLKKDLPEGSPVTADDVFFAFPLQPGQVTANDFSKYRSFATKVPLAARSALLWQEISTRDNRDGVWDVVKKIRAFVEQHSIVIPPRSEFEISHHFGLDRFDQVGASLFTIVNRGYCKKVIVLLPGQKHPEHVHKRKDESFLIVAGSMRCSLNEEIHEYRVGDVITLEPGVRHAFESNEGCVFEELSSTHFVDDSYYTDLAVASNKYRKTRVAFWMD
jgi:sialic acid synthase SpsE/mannose-6-phosphate isomerase-like protein (cupin superfamily)